MGVLKTKILTYSPEQYFTNEAAFTGTTVNYGTAVNTTGWSTTGGNPAFNATGGPDASGCWQFSINNATEQALRGFGSTTTGTIYAQTMDGDYSAGAWFRIPTQINSLEGIIDIVRFGGNNTGSQVSLVGNGVNIGKLQFNNPTTVYSTNRYDDGLWHYYAERMYVSGSNFIKERYLDGVSIGSVTITATAPTLWYVTMGDNSITNTVTSPAFIEIAHEYVAPYSSIDATAISQIWTIGSTGGATNISITATPLTASGDIVSSTITTEANVLATPITANALHVNSTISTQILINIYVSAFSIAPIGLEPTIVTTTFENIQVFTSIPVSATIIQPLITTDQSINIVIIETLNASATSVNATFSQTADTRVIATPLTASALSLDVNITTIKQVSYASNATTANATMIDPPIIISDNSAVIPADIMSMSLLFAEPIYGTPAPDPLYWKSGTLQSKIATYAIQEGTEFNTNTASVANVTVYGTLPSGWSSYNQFDGVGYTATYDATDGPYASGTGCWKQANARIRTVLQTGITTDLNYTTGIWFKLPTLPTGTANEGTRLFTLGTNTASSTSLDYSVSVTGSSHATQPSKLAISLNGTTYDYLTTTLNTTDWYYIAVRRTGSSGVNNFEVYINGILQLVKTNSDTSATYTSFHIGNNAVSANGGSIKFQNFHVAPAAILTSYEIDQIWQAGTKFPPAQRVDAVHASDRFLATALATSPTIVAVKGDHVEVTTSVTVSSTFPEPSWSTGEIVKFNTGFFGGIEAVIGDNIFIETNGDKSISPEALNAIAIFVEPILARQPAKANASLPMPFVYTAPNYFEMVMVHEPVFYIEDGAAVPNNYGSWQETANWERVAIDVNVQSGKQMNAVGNQKSWMANAQGAVITRPRLQADIPDYRTKINDLYASRNLTIEVWYTSIGYGSTVNHLAYEESGPIFNDGITQITEVWDFFGCVPGSDPQNKIMLIGERLKSYDFSQGLEGAFATWRSFPDANPKRDEWNHLVVTYEAVTNPQQLRRKIYLNGGIISNQLLTIGISSINPSGSAFTDDGYIDISLDQPQNIWPGPEIGGGVQLSGSQTIKLHDGVKVDEFAIYPKTLSGTQVVEHYNFITSLSPNANYNSTVTEFLVQIGNHQVLPQQNTLYDEDPMPALAARIPEPLIIAGKSKILSVDSSEADALLVNPSIITQSINYAQSMLSNINLERVYVANNQYYNYVKTIPNLHRYYSFDTATPLENHGSDTTYTVPDITVSGEIVQYGQSINNKSALTAGVTPLSGITLYESQHDDSWGSVGNGNFFTSFWMERPYFDNNPQGLRIVANINSPSNNHYVLLYQLSGLLWLDSWDGTTLTRTSSTTNPALFGYGTHQVLISFDNANQNARHIRVYVDKVLFIEQNLGNINLDFVNGGTDAPNNSSNNYPRMSLGSLITPFEITSLPQYPANIRTVYDEIIWANTDATSTIINALYNNMPTRIGSFNEVYVSTASCESVNPTISTGTTIIATSMLAFPAQTEPTITTVYSILIETDAMDATADVNDAERSDSINVVSDLFLATFGFGSAGTPRIINATPITASLNLVNRTVTGVQTGQGNGILINGQRTFDPNSKWVQYVLTTTENTLIPMKEVR